MKTFTRILIVFIACVIILVFGLYGGLQLPVAKKLLAQSAGRFTRDTGYTLTLGKIEGNIFSDVTIARIAVADRNGIWLDIERLHLVWHPLAIATGNHVVEMVTADAVHALHVPVLDKDNTPSKQQSFNIQNILPYLPQTVTLDDIYLSPEIAGTQAQHLTLSAAGNAERYRAHLRTMSGPKTSLDMNGSLLADNINASLTLNEETNGVLARLLSLPAQTGLNINLAVQTDLAKITHITSGEITAGKARITLSGAYNNSTRVVDGRISFQFPELRDFQTLAGTDLRGDIKGDVDFSGPLNAVKTTLTITSRSIGVNNIAVTHVDWADKGLVDVATLKKPAFNFAGNLKNNVQQQDKPGPYEVSTDYHLQGDLQAIKGDITAAVKSPYGPSQLHLTGAVDVPGKIFDGNLNAALTHQNNKFTLAVKGKADPTAINVEQLDLTGTGIALHGTGRWDNVEKLATGKFNVDADNLIPMANMVGIAASGNVKASGELGTSHNKQQADISVTALDLTYNRKNIKLQNTARLSIQENNGILSPASFAFAGGTVTAAGEFDANHLSAKINAAQLQVAALTDSDVLKGTVNGQINVSGLPQAPLIDLQAAVKGSSGPYPVNASVTGSWRQNDLRLQVTGTSTRTTAKLLAGFQSRLSVLPFHTDFSDKTPLNGSLVADMKLDVFNPALWSSRQQLAGNVSGKMSLSGTVGAPQTMVRFSLDKVNYIHSPSGICLNNLHAIILGSNKQISLQNLSSNDSKGGNVSGHAALSLTDRKNLEGVIAFNHFRLFCGGLASGILDGKLNASGNAQSSLIAGNLRLGPLNVQLPGAQHNAGIPEIDTMRINEDKLVPEEKQKLVRLNIDLQAPNRIFIRGRGLDAEFGGSLHIVGNTNSPVINGDFKSRQGRFTLLDRNLTLTNALLRFEGPIPPSPFLDVEASTAVKSTTITITLNGPATEPKLLLTTSPVLPQDEALALLLFGRQLNSISPFQAIQLAQAARTLAGLDGGKPGVLDRARAKLGLDALDVQTGTNNDVTVSTGKYVTERVYVGVQQGSEPQDKKVKTEIELTPAVSANTTIDAQGNQGVGLGWRHDY